MTLLAAALAATAAALALPPRSRPLLSPRSRRPATAHPPPRHRAPPAHPPFPAEPDRAPPTGRPLDAGPSHPSSGHAAASGRGSSGGRWSGGRAEAVRRLRTCLPGRLGQAAGRGSGPSRTDIADLTERLAAFARAGLPAARSWELLAEAQGPGAAIAARVAAMSGAGGSVSAGLRLAAAELPDGRGAGPAGTDAVSWLALATEVVERSGAPSAVVHDGVAAGLLAELSRADEQEVALAGARTTAGVLAALPLAGIALGLLMGANVPAILLGTTLGRVCLALGAGCWIAGRWWTRRLVTSATRVT